MIFFFVQSSRVYAQATVLTFSGAPGVTVGTSGNTGSVNTKARWSNVATVNGVAVDMEAVILANTVASANSVTWSTTSGQAKVSLVGEGDQSVDLAYHFYQTGTTTPVVVSPEVIFRSLDGGLRQEVIQTLKTQVAKYTIDNSSSITVTSVLNGAGTSDDEYKFTSTSGTNLVTNPGFESGNTGFTSNYTYLGEHGNSNSIAQGSWGEGKYAWFNDNRAPNTSNTYFNLTVANNGDSFLLVDIGNDTTHPFWQTSLNLTPGKNYVFSAFLANINDSNSSIKPNVNFVLTNSGGTTVLAPSGNLNSGGSSLTPWQEVTSSFTASLASNTLELISNTTGLIGNDLAMDDVEVREVLPENQTGLSITLQPASVFYFTFEKANGLGEFAFDGSLNSIFLSPQATLVDITAPANPSVTSLTTTDTTPALSGSAEAYSVITLTAGGATFATTANGSGNWSVDTGSATPSSGTFAPLTNGSANSLQVVSTDAAGNASGTGTGSLIIQVPSGGSSTISPSPASIAATGNASATITVQAKNASNSNLTVGGSAVVLATTLGTLGSVTDNGDGTYSATLTSATAPGTASITGTINGQAMPATTVSFVTLTLTMNTVALDDAINLTEDDTSVSVTGTTAGVEAGRSVSVVTYNAQSTGVWSAPLVTGAGTASVAVQSGYLAIKPTWGATTNIVSTTASVGPLNLTGANYSVDVWLPTAYVTDGHLTVQPYLKDATGKTAAIVVRAASSLTGNSWNTLTLNGLSTGSLISVTSGFDLTSVTQLGLQLNANAKPTNVTGDVRFDNLAVTQPASGSPVNFNFAATQTYSATVGADGSWSAVIPAVDAQALPASSQVIADVTNLAGDVAPQARRTVTHTQAAPTISIASVTGDDSVSSSEDDVAVSFTGTTSNVESGQTVTLSLNGASFVGTVSAGSWSISVPAVAIQVLSGSVSVTANVANQAGDNATQTSRSFTAANDAPVITLPTAPVVAEDSAAVAINDDVAIADTESHSQTLTLTATGGTISLSTVGLSFSSGDGSNDTSMVFSGTLSAINTALDSLTFTPTPNLSGSNAGGIQIASNDGNGGSSSQALHFDISAVNDAPTITGSPTTSVNQGSAYSFTPTGADVDSGDTLTYSIANKPSWASFNNSTGQLSGTPGNSDVGTTAGIVITVSDNHGATTNLASFSLSVSNINDAPTITGSPATSVNQGSAYSFIPAGADVDSGDTLTYSIANKPSWASFNTSTGQLSGTPGNSDVGTTAGIVITVSDNHGATTNLASFSLSVSNINDAPTITGSPATSVNQGSAYSFTPTGADVDSGDTLTYSIANKPSWASFNTSTGQLSGTPGNSDVGTTAGIVITVSDNHGATSNLASFSLSVSNINDAPTITGSPATSVNQGNAFSFTPTAADVDIGDTLSYSIANKPNWASFNTSTGQLSGTPGNSDVGTTAGIVITVSDNHGATTNLASFSLSVSNINDAPTITGSPATSVNQGSAYSFTPTGADVDTGDTLTYSIANKPSWASFNTSTGQLSGTPGNSDVGTTAGIVITVSDNHGATTNLASFSLSVTNINDAPSISGVPAVTASEDNLYSFSPTANDPDAGDSLVFSITHKPTWASFNTSTGVLSGTPANSDVGTTTGIVIGVSDGHLSATLSSFDLTVTNTNDAPVITLPPAPAVRENDVAVALADSVQLADDDGDNQRLRLTITGGSVTLPLAGLTLLAGDGQDDALLEVSGSLADLNTALDAMLFTPTPQLSGNLAASIQLQADDGQGGSANQTLSFDISPSDVSVISLPTAPAVTEDSQNVPVGAALLGHIEIADGDQDNQTVTLTVTGGSVSLSINGLSFSLGDGTADRGMTFTGNLADINAALANLTFTPDSNLSGSHAASIRVDTLDDNGSSSATLNLDITGVNDAPVISLPATRTLLEDSTQVSLNGTVSVSDVDGDVQTLTLNATGGSLDFNPIGVVLLMGDGSGDTSVTMVGSVAAINSALASLSFTPTANISGSGAAQLRVQTDDGRGLTDNRTLNFVITASNDAPVITTGSVPAVVEDQANVNLGGLFSLADVDGDNQAVTLDVVGGTVSLDASGITLSSGTSSNTSHLVFSGSISAINSALNTLIFNPSADLSGLGAGQLTLTSNDGKGGQHSQTASLDINPQNDAPRISGTSPTSLAAGTTYSFTPVTVDPDLGDVLSFSASGLPSWASIDPLTGAINGTPTDADLGDYPGIVVTVTDGQLSRSLPAFSLRVAPSNTAPVALAADLLATERVPLNLVATAQDAENQSLTYTIVSPPSHGSLSGSGPNWQYTPAMGYTGPDSFSFTASDGALTSNSATISITVQGDLDADTIADPVDQDMDGDGISNTAESNLDTDADGIPNSRDRDSDNDGIPDSIEGAADTDGDGLPDYLDKDSDNDGLPDSLEGPGDSDGDGTADFRDLDSDNDGVADDVENHLTGKDSDGDGIDDSIDIDSTHGVDLNRDGVDDLGLIDSDQDGMPDMADADSDGDGVPDALEFGLSGRDQDSDGIDDSLDATPTGGANSPSALDRNGDGRLDQPKLRDTDGDGLVDYLDEDSDNDGVADGLENRITGRDSDGDGIDDSFDVDVRGGQDANGDGISDGSSLLDSDGDGVANLFDLDSDNDGLLDTVEAGLLDRDNNGFADAGQNLVTSNLPNRDGDGLPDILDLDSNNDGRNDIAQSPFAALDSNHDGHIDATADTDKDGIDDRADGDKQLRGSNSDTDMDGVPDSRDSDDDNDGLPDVLEGVGDADGDGIPNRLDRDSDNDGLSDHFEANLPALTRSDSDSDGLDDAYDPENHGQVDSDSDGIADNLDVDQTHGLDANHDGIDDALVTQASIRDTDADSVADPYDTDSDGDTLADNLESGLIKASGKDQDRDGIDDAFDADFTGGKDADLDGIDDESAAKADLDHDGLLAYRDPDTDGDGYTDQIENGDFNNDHIIDREQPPTKMRTAVRGGATDLGLLILAALGLTLRKRSINKSHNSRSIKT